MRYSFVKMTGIAAVAALSLGSAKAAIITNTYTVVGTNFTSTAASPYTSIIESFTVTFNSTATTATPQTVGISLNSASTIIPTSTLAFSHIYVPGAVDTLIVGGLASTVATSDPASTDFAVTISNASTANFSITALSFTVGTGATYTATTRTVGSPPTPTTVPEPASLTLFGSAAAMMAFVRRRRIMSTHEQ